ncbi:MAG: DEAD/DEAH box helicase [Pseudobdellovibrio sp.]
MPAIQAAVKKAGYETPTPIQVQAIPHLLMGKDLLGCAQTGTGKTAAFALPIIQNIVESRFRVQPKNANCLILTPTRELALQIYENFKTYSEGLPLSVAVVYGGVGINPQINAVKNGVDVLIATPGRLLDLIQQNKLSVKQIKTFVLDEADRMLDMGFIHDIKKVLTMIPQQRQTLFFSATMPNEIAKLSASMLKNPVKIEVNPVSSTAERVEQFVMYVEQSKKRDLLRHLLKDPKFYRVIVFTRTKHGANRVSDMLAKNNISSEAIHGNKSQNARQRALDLFKNNKIQVLIATDIAARGIDVDGITHVINFEVPNVAENYVHRIGRTARAGLAGIAISFCDIEEKSYIRDIEKTIGQPIPVDREHPYHSDSVEKAHTMSAGKAKAQIEQKHNRRSGGFQKRYGASSGSRSNGGGSRSSSENKNGDSAGGSNSGGGGFRGMGTGPKPKKKSFFSRFRSSSKWALRAFFPKLDVGIESHPSFGQNAGLNGAPTPKIRK